MGDHEWACPLSQTRLKLQWRVIELWTLAADDLLAAADVGLIPLVPLTRMDGPPEAVLRRCRQRIDLAPENEQENLLAVVQVMAQMRYNDAGLLSIFGVKQMFNESPLIQEIVEETRVKTVRGMVLETLETRFGELPLEIAERLNTVVDERRLRRLATEAWQCASLDDFRAHLV
jgi:predicted transposase YdaD